jgi:his kinase A (phosphoacceptor) domain./histidine kinase-, DNA gyrase B-, and HSP90-like ATPase
MSAQEDYGDGEEPYSYIMYIDIGPITRYIVTLNWVFFAVLLAISSVMCLLGFRFGRDIEKEAERQQTFFQNASHELKTPLMAIQGYAEGIQAGVMDAGDAADVILEESDRMAELVEELLDISKIDMGRQRLTLSETDIRELLYDGIRAVEPTAASSIAIVPDFPEEPIIVKCDDVQLRRAVTNILSNGLRYARSELCLTCRTDKRHVTIRIQDDGDGIAEEDLPHIFDRFYMGKSGKSGIGLALTKEIVHLHRGTIRAYNGDSGAVFEISIPVSR